MKRLLIGVLIVIAAVMAAMWFSRHNTVPTVNHLISIHKSHNAAVPIGGPFILTDQDGRERKETEFRGKWMLVYFGFTFCPDICPMAVAAMSEAMALLGDKGEKLVPIFITLDPKRDNVAVLQAFIHHFDKRFLALTGSELAINKVAESYKVYHAQKEVHSASAKENGGYYLIDHSSFIYLMNPEGQYEAHFTHSTPPEEMADAIRRKLQE